MRRLTPRSSDLLRGGASAIVFAAGLVVVGRSVNPGYFGYDDALNDMMPAYHGIARLVTAGLPPILDARIVHGGDHLVNVAHAPFHPLTLLAAASWLFGDANVVAAFTAFLLILAIFSGTYFTARAGLRLSQRDALLASVVVSTGPLLMGQYINSWWAVALGMAGYFWATGALFWAARNVRPLRLLLLGATTLGLFLTGWPQSWLVFAITCLLTANHTRLLSAAKGVRALIPAALLGSAVLGGVLASLPALSEYWVLSKAGFFGRPGEVANAENALVPTLNQLLAFANPVSGDFMRFHWGYSWVQIPIGFVSLLLLVPMFFTVHKPELWRTDRTLQLLAANTIVCYLLTQLPSAHGPIHLPVRYLPYGQFFLILTALYYLARTGRAWTRLRFDLAALYILAGAIYTSWRVEYPVADRLHSIVLPLLYTVTTVGVLWLFRNPSLRRRLEEVLVGLGVLLMCLQLPAATIFTYDTATLPSSSEMQELAAKAAGGFLLDNQLEPHSNGWVHGGLSSRYAMYGIGLVNGYEPIQNVPYAIFIPQDIHGNLNEDSFQKLGAAPGRFAGQCWLDLFRVSAVLADVTMPAAQSQILSSCGFALDSTRAGTSLYVKARAFVDPRSTVSASTEGLQLSGDRLVSDLSEQVTVDNPTTTAGQVSFARIALPGYIATLDGVPLQLNSVDGVLLTVVVPPRAHGTLRLHYWPSSWGVALPVAGVGLVLIVALPVAVAIWRRRKAQRPAMVSPPPAL